MHILAQYWGGSPRRPVRVPFWGFLRGLFPFPLTGYTRILLITCVVIHLGFLFGLRVLPYEALDLYSILSLSLVGVLHGYVWELVSYIFLHSLTSIWHLLFNMFGLYILGIPVERSIGSRSFLRLFFISGVTGGVVYLLWAFISGNYIIPAVGASGAIMGVLTAFALLYPEARLYLFFAIPVRARQLIPLSIGMEIFFAFADTNIAWQVHLGGMLGAWVYLRRPWRPAYIYSVRMRLRRLKQLLFGPRVPPRYPY